jgi:hypothetical protein
MVIACAGQIASHNLQAPVVVSPVKAIFLILLDEANGLPASKPKPLQR